MSGQKKIVVKIYSDNDDIEPVKSLLKKFPALKNKISINEIKSLNISPDEIIICLLNNFNKNFLRNLGLIKHNFPGKFFFLFQNSDPLYISSVTRLGYINIFILPEEINQFISTLHESVDSFSEKINSGSVLFEDLNILIGDSPGIKRVKELAKKVSEQSTSNVLILGETGTGKGLLARILHNNSPNRSEPFVDIVCSAIPENLLESELFGYEPGAFTNAQNLKVGLFELAGNGTLFLDEIGDLSLNIQSKLLRAIERKVIRRLGGIEDIPINARIISATNKNLENMIKEGIFREDLYHRLKVISFFIPPLRERNNDIIKLAYYFISVFKNQFSRKVKKIDKETENILLYYSWPGNVRELRNSIERAVLLSEEENLSKELFLNLIENFPETDLNPDRFYNFHPHLVNLIINYETTNLQKLTKIYVQEILERTRGNKLKASELLGVSRPKLDRIMKK